MAYILDKKKDLSSYGISQGTLPTVNFITDTTITPNGATEPYLSVSGNGQINIGGPNSSNALDLNCGVQFKFKQIIGTDTNYDLTMNDYAIEIISDSYMTVTLPTSAGNGGLTYIISRGSNNNALVVKSQNGETIDGRQESGLWRKNTHVKVMSNSINAWYIV